MRARLLAMLLAVALPLLAIAALMAWENYRDRVAHLRQELNLVTANGESVLTATLGDTERLLRATASLATAPGGSPDDCNSLLERLLLIERPRYEDFAVVGRNGQMRCSAGLGNGAERQARLATAFLSGPSLENGLVVGEPSGAPRPTLPVGVRLTGERFSGAILATLSMGWLSGWLRGDWVTSRQVMGLVDSHGQFVPLGLAGATRPAPPELSALLRRPGSPPVFEAEFEGSSFQFRSAALPGGPRLLVGLSTMAQRARAKEVLVQRLAALGLLLLAGLAALVTGVNASVARPVRRLSVAVVRWRAGGGFNPGSVESAPREIAALSRSFGRAVAALDEREAQLRAASDKQELLMQEIHHRVKNNLQIVASLLNLQASRIKLPEARAEFQTARDRIRALATLHRHLYAYGELHTINMRGFLVELCGQLLQALGETPTGGRIQLDIEAPELQISSDQAVPMALVVTEAVSNAAKYAFPRGRGGHIAVRLLVVDDGASGETLRMTIEDDGVGMASGRGEAPRGGRTGIGTHLIRGFARQLRAKMTLTHDGGTRYVFDIPLRRGGAEALSEPMAET